MCDDPIINPEPYEISKARIEADSLWHGFNRKIKLTEQECKDLVKFIYDMGFLSHEFHEPIHQLFHKIEKFLDEK